MERIEPVKFLKSLWKEYKLALLILVLGLLLMLWPQSKKETVPLEQSVIVKQEIQSLEDRLEKILSSLSGAGKVKVLLTEGSGEETVYQTNREVTSEDTWNENVIIITNEKRGEEGLILRIDPPKYMGAVILCQGADDPSVKLAITQAVCSTTGLPTNRIAVLKMK